MTNDLLKRAEPFLNVCGSCDAGLPMSCTCPDGDYRPVMSALCDEIAALHALIADLPHTNDQLFAWLRDHCMALGAGTGVVLTAVRRDLMRAAGLDEVERHA